MLIFSCWCTDLAYPLVSVLTLKALLVQNDEHPVADFLYVKFTATRGTIAVN